jgi:HemY protein
MRFVIYSIIVLLVAGGLAIVSQQDPGYLMISFRGWTIETSAIVAIAAVLITFLVLYFAFRILISTGLMPKRVRRWHREHSDNNSRKSLAHGILELQMGKWSKAEKLLLRGMRNEDLAPLAYMGAARAAQSLGANDRRDSYLDHARLQTPKSILAITIAQAQIQAEGGHDKEAINTLAKLSVSQQNNPYVLKLQSQLYTNIKDWPALVSLLPLMRRYSALPQHEYDNTEHLAYSGLISHVAHNKDSQALLETWKEMPKRLHKKEDLIADITCSLINSNQSNEAEKILFKSLNKNWSDRLIYIYGLLDGNAEINLNRACNWLPEHKDSPALLLSLGRLAMRSHQWQNARKYFEESIKILPNSETYQELGNLLVFLNEEPQALECYRRGLSLTSDNIIQSEQKTGVIEHAKLPRPKSSLEEKAHYSPELAARA